MAPHPKQDARPSFARPTQASLRRGPPSPPPSSKQLSRHDFADTPPFSSTAPTTVSSSASTRASQRSRAPRVTDKNFREAELARFGIVVEENNKARVLGRPENHFGTLLMESDTRRKEDVVGWYQKKHNQNHSYIWLSLLEEDAKRISLEYRQMVEADEEEAKFAYIGKTEFFQQDQALHTRDQERPRTAYCKMEWAPRPDGDLLQTPPLLDATSSSSVGNTSSFTFTNKPDCTFWLPQTQFNPEYSHEITTLTYVVPKAKVITPYLTIEFKKADQDTKAAVNQLAAAGALILYNRVILRNKRLENQAASESPGDLRNIKHYGVAFAAQHAYIYIMTPRFSDPTSGDKQASRSKQTQRLLQWNGCSVELLRSLNVAEESGALNLRRWMNEIQNWGLGEYNNDVVQDIKGILGTFKDGENEVSLLIDK